MNAKFISFFFSFKDAWGKKEDSTMRKMMKVSCHERYDVFKLNYFSRYVFLIVFVFSALTRRCCHATMCEKF